MGGPQPMQLNQAWESALTKAVGEFKHLVASAGSKSWKLVQPGSSGTTPTVVKPATAPAEGYPFPDVSSLQPRTSDVVVHRRTSKTGDTYRATLELPLSYFGERGVSIETFARAIDTPEAWSHWQKLVQDANTLDLLDVHTRINSVRYKLGWPSSPRDAITIARTYSDSSSLIDISTSLPRLPNEPAYLRPAPPYVRASVKLQAWCVQIQKPSSAGAREDRQPGEDVLKITCFWNWNPHGTWAVGVSVPQHLPSLLVGLVDFVTSEKAVIPGIVGYGRQISIHGLRYDPVRSLLALDYAVVPEPTTLPEAEQDATQTNGDNGEGKDKSVVLEMNAKYSWDIQLHLRSAGDSSPVPWKPTLSLRGDTLHLSIDHADPAHANDLIRIHATVERTSGNAGDVWLNGVLMASSTALAFPAATNHLSPGQIDDTASTFSDFTLDSSLVPPDASSYKARSRSGTLRSFSGIDVALHKQPSLMLARSQKRARGRSPAQEKSVGSLIRRNYIYFTSFLQEPDAKWRQISESKGVTVHQLNSIDPTLLVYRAEAVFVGVSLLDLWAVLTNFGTRTAWSKTFEKAELLEHVNEMSELWHIHHRAGKSMAARDALFLRTTYKSPDSIHIFGLSVDDTSLFPDLPAPDEPHSIRQTIALQGWSLEKLSPNTVHVTLIEQADPRGWTTKAAMQQALITAVSGLGEFAIKSGAPPAVARLEGAQLIQAQFDLPKQILKIKYEPATAWMTVSASKKSGALPAHLVAETPSLNTPGATPLETPTLLVEEPTQSIQCTIRCDSDKYWSSGVDLVVDPPPRSVTALRRHKLAEAGGGLWVTTTHDKSGTSDSFSLTLRQRQVEDKRDRSPLSVNGSPATVDSEELAESELQSMRKQKRSKPTRRPLDQPPALPVLRRQATSSSLRDGFASPDLPAGQIPQMSPVVASNVWSRFSSPLTSIYSSAAQSSRNIFLAKPLSDTQAELAQRSPVDALGVAFEQLFRIHVDRFSETTSSDAQWQQISKGPGGIVECKTLPFVSQSIPVYRSSRIIQNFSAPEIISVIKNGDHRRVWDAKLMEVSTLQSYGNGVTVDWMAQSMAFPLRPRGFLTANMTVKGDDVGSKSPLSATAATPNTTLTFHVSTSNFDRSSLMTYADRFNPNAYGVGNVVLEGWILETLDPYSHDHYPVPSTRCMYVTAVDFGYLPLAANNLANAALPQRLSAIEKLLKTTPASLPMLKTPRDRLIVGKDMLHARQNSQRTTYTIQSPQASSTLLQSQCLIDGSYECILYVHQHSAPQEERSSFPQEWYTEETTEPKVGGKPTLPSASVSIPPPNRTVLSPPEGASRLSSASVGSLPRIRSPLSHLAVPKAHRPALPLCEVVFERHGGACYDITVDCRILSAEKSIPVALPGQFDNGGSKDVHMHVDKAPAPVLRSALNENDVYSVKVTDPSHQTRHPLSDQEGQNEEPETSAPCLLRLSIKRRATPGDHPFMHKGRPIEVRDNLQGPLSPQLSAAEWPRLQVVDTEKKGPVITPLACDVCLLQDKTMSTAVVEDVKEEMTEVESKPTADGTAVSSQRPKALVAPATPVRMNSIYRYLTQPVNLNRFSWPISGFPSPAAPKPEVPAEQVPASTDVVQEVPVNEEIAPIDSAISSNVAFTQSSTVLLLILAVSLSFMLGFMFRTLVMKAEDFVIYSPSHHPDAQPSWTEFQRLLQLDALGRRFIFGIAVDHGAE